MLMVAVQTPPVEPWTTRNSRWSYGSGKENWRQRSARKRSHGGAWTRRLGPCGSPSSSFRGRSFRPRSPEPCLAMWSRPPLPPAPPPQALQEGEAAAALQDASRRVFARQVDAAEVNYVPGDLLEDDDDLELNRSDGYGTM